MSEPSFVERVTRASQGFLDAKIILLGVELRLFDRLSAGSASAAELVEDLDLTLRGTEIVADALVALGYLTKQDGIYANTPDVDRHLVRGQPESIAFITGHRNRMFHSWAHLEEIVRHGKPEREREKATLTDSDANCDFILGMAEVSAGRVGPILDRLGLASARRFVDLGGGPAQYCCEAARRHPELEACLVDLELTVQVARDYIAGQGLTDRVETRVCDFFREDELDLGGPADVVLISQVLHAEGEGPCRELLHKLRPHVRPGGRVAIAENLVDPGRTSPLAGARFAVNMLAGTTRGRTYTADEISSWLCDAGFDPHPVERIADRTYLIQGTLNL